jgi:outer membrane lipoprotein carrier protein
LIKALLLSFTLVFSAHAKKASVSANDYAILRDTTAKYRNSKLVEIPIQKTVKSDLTGKETKYSGTIFLSSGLFRMENKEPEKSLLVFDGSTMWSEQAASADFPGPPQVTKAKLDKKGKSQVLFATLLTRDPITKHFKILKESISNDSAIYEASPLSKELNVKTLTIKISKKTKLVTEISYQDDIGNLTTMMLGEPHFKKSYDKKLFHYQPPKGAPVNEI